MTRHLDCDRCSRPNASLRIVSVDGDELAVFCDRCLRALLDAVDRLLPPGKGSPRFHAWRQRRASQRERAKERTAMQSVEASQLFQRLLEKGDEPPPRSPARRRQR